jgi:hypothetical protein
MKKAKPINERMFQFVFDGDMVRASKRFEIIQPVISERLLLDEIDNPRMEICSCFVIGAYTACITLTNHLLERYCKELLLVHDHGNEFMRSYKMENNLPVESLSAYLKKDLSTILRACKSKGLLSKDEWKILDKYRDIFRNGYSHYDPPKILQGATFTVSTIGLNGELGANENVKIEEMPHVGISIDDFARWNAWEYFIRVENFIRSTIRYFHNPDHDPGVPKVPYLG